MALSAVLAALSRRPEKDGEIDAGLWAHSRVFEPTWKPVESMRDPEELPLERASCSCSLLDSLVQGEEKLIVELKACANESETLIDLLKQYFASQQLPQAAAQEECFSVDYEAHLYAKSDVDDDFCKMVKDFAPGLSRRLVVVILRCCIRRHCFDPIFGLVASGQVSANECPELIDFLVSEEQVPILSLCLSRVTDLRVSHRRDILDLFLRSLEDLSKDGMDSFEDYKFAWHNLASSLVAQAENLEHLEEGVNTGAGAELLDSFETHPGELDSVDRTPRKLESKMQEEITTPSESVDESRHQVSSQKKARSRTGRRRKTKLQSEAKNQQDSEREDSKAREMEDSKAREREDSKAREREETPSQNPVEAVAKKKLRNEMAIKFAASFDCFAAWEMSMHAFLCSGTDDVVLSLILGNLDNEQILKLVFYLNKWLKKYNTRPLPFRGPSCEDDRRLIPTAAAVVQWLCAVLEDRFSSFVLSKDFKSQIEITRQQVDIMLDDTNLVSLQGITKHLLEHRPLPSATPGFGVSEHIIEYLQV